MMRNIRVAIVGAGYMSTEHAKAFSSLENVEIVGVNSRSRAAAVELAGQYGVGVYNSIGDMYVATQADIVVCAVPELEMARVAIECFRHPWKCLLEKPVGIDYKSALEITKASLALNSDCFVALNRRCYSSTMQALDVLREDSSPRVINIYDQQDMEVARSIGHPETIVQNWMYANSIHLVDFINVFGRGEVAKVEIMSPWVQDCPSNVIAVIYFDGGDIAIYQANWTGPGPWSVSVSTAAQRLELRPLENLSIQMRGSRSVMAQEISSADLEFKPGLLMQAKILVDGIRGTKINLPTLLDANRSMKLVEQIYGLAAE